MCIVFLPSRKTSSRNVYQHTQKPSSSLHRHVNQQNHASQENLIEETPYISAGGVTNGNATSHPTHLPVQNLFDDVIYGEGYLPPPVKMSPESSRTTLQFGRPPSHRKVDSDESETATSTGSRGQRKSTKRSSLESFPAGFVKVPSLKRKTESRDNLLEEDPNDDDRDYDDVIVNVPALIMAQQDDSDAAPLPSRETLPNYATINQSASSNGSQSQARYRDSEIYCNLMYAEAGGKGNIGQRWEAYWKAQTLMKSRDQGQRSARGTQKAQDTSSKKK